MKKVAIFGSSRTDPESGLYGAVEKMGKDFASYGWVVVTGGGPGTMEAANKGAKLAKGKSIGNRLGSSWAISFRFPYAN